MSFDQYRNEVDIQPTIKSNHIEQLLTSILGQSRIQAVKNRSCVDCNDTNVTFRDDESVNEYAISGLCQSCQDSVFFFFYVFDIKLIYTRNY